MKDSLPFVLPPGAREIKIPPLVTERGERLEGLSLAYHMYGDPSLPVLLVAHSLTSDSRVGAWWELVCGEGPEFAIDTSTYCVLCFNYATSCYGSSAPRDGATRRLRLLTIRDHAAILRAGLAALGVQRVEYAMGMSMGGMVVLELVVSTPLVARGFVMVASAAAQNGWAMAHLTMQRNAVFADAKWAGGLYDPADPPRRGLSEARGLGLFSFRTADEISSKFGRKVMDEGRSSDALDKMGRSWAEERTPTHFAVESFLEYQGAKFARRFDAAAYVALTLAVDSHDIGRGRDGGEEGVLRRIRLPGLIVGIDSDTLYPLADQERLATSLPRGSLAVLHSKHGHDAFLIELAELNAIILAWRLSVEAPPTRPKL
jgi:homoserine O-acetyltransferase